MDRVEGKLGDEKPKVRFNEFKPLLCCVEGSPATLAFEMMKLVRKYLWPNMALAAVETPVKLLAGIGNALRFFATFADFELDDTVVSVLMDVTTGLQALSCLLEPDNTADMDSLRSLRTADPKSLLAGLYGHIVSNPTLNSLLDDFVAKSEQTGELMPEVLRAIADMSKLTNDP
jgi:hypothetical protein